MNAPHRAGCGAFGSLSHPPFPTERSEVGSRTGVEIGGNSCTLVAVSPGLSGARVEAFRVLRYPPRDSAQFERELKQLIRDGVFPRVARVVVWPNRSAEGRFTLNPGSRSILRATVDHASSAMPGLAGWINRALVGVSVITQPPNGSADVLFAAADRAEVRSFMRPFRLAGFVVESLTTPGLALAAVARARRAESSESGTAYLELHPEQGMLAIVARGTLISSRHLHWQYPEDPDDPRARLPQLYTFVSRVGPEIGHACDAVRQEHGIGIDRIVMCGTLANLRSLAGPLAAELDLQVEVLDSLEAIDPDGIPEPRKTFCDAAASLYPAFAVAVEEGAVNLWPREGSLVRVPKPVAGASALATSAAAAAVVSYLLVAALMAPPAAERGDGQAPEAVALVVATKPLAAEHVAALESAGLSVLPVASSLAASDQPGGQVENGGAGKVGEERPSASQVQPRTPSPSRGAAARAREITARADMPLSTERPVAGVAGGAGSIPPSAQQQVASPMPIRQEESALNVASILRTGDRKLAIINGKIVSVGDRTGGFAVVEILPSAVVFRDSANRIVRVSLRGAS